MLTLPIKKKWFDMIFSGVKKEEYREIKPYWTRRFINAGMINDTDGTLTGQKVSIVIKCGYQKNSPAATITVVLDVGIGRKELGAPDFPVYILKILEVKYGR